MILCMYVQWEPMSGHSTLETLSTDEGRVGGGDSREVNLGYIDVFKISG